MENAVAMLTEACSDKKAGGSLTEERGLIVTKEEATEDTPFQMVSMGVTMV